MATYSLRLKTLLMAKLNIRSVGCLERLDGRFLVGTGFQVALNGRFWVSPEGFEQIVISVPPSIVIGSRLNQKGTFLSSFDSHRVECC